MSSLFIAYINSPILSKGSHVLTYTPAELLPPPPLLPPPSQVGTYAAPPLALTSSAAGGGGGGPGQLPLSSVPPGSPGGGGPGGGGGGGGGSKASMLLRWLEGVEGANGDGEAIGGSSQPGAGRAVQTLTAHRQVCVGVGGSQWRR